MRKSLLFSSRLVKSKKWRGGEGGFISVSWSPGKMKLSRTTQRGGGGSKAPLRAQNQRQRQAGKQTGRDGETWKHRETHGERHGDAQTLDSSGQRWLDTQMHTGTPRWTPLLKHTEESRWRCAGEPLLRHPHPHLPDLGSHSLSQKGRDNQVPGAGCPSGLEHHTFPTWDLSAFSQPLS